MAQNEKINELYSQLREADSLAQKGDKQAATDAQQIYSYIQELSRENFVETPRILGGAIGVGAGAGVKGLQMIPTGISKAGQLFGQAAAKEMLAKGASPDVVKKWFEASNMYTQHGIPYQKAMDYKEAHALVQPQVQAAQAAKKLEPLNALFPTLPPTIPTTGAPPSAPPITKPSMVNSIMNAPMRGLEKVGSAVAPYASAAGRLLNPMAALGGAGYAGVDMYNRGKTGDTTGENIAMVGALGSLASMAPHPLVKGVGTGVALSAEALNAYRDKLRRGEIVHGGAQQNVDASGNAYATGGLVHLAEGQSTGKSDSPSGMQAGLQYLEELLRAIKNPEKTPVVPVPNRWFSQPDKFPQVQGLVEKALTHSGQPREAFHSGAFIDPRTGEVLDRRIYNNLGVVIDPKTGKPMMSVGNQAGIEVLDPKTGSYTKSNLVRKNLFTPTGGDPLLNRLPFIATIENKGVHHYGLGTQYATPTELYNTMKGENPTLRPRSRGEVFGMGDVVGQARIGGRGEPKNIYEKLFVAPKGSDVPGVRLGTTGGGGGGYINPINPLMGSGLTPFGMKTGGLTAIKKK